MYIEAALAAASGLKYPATPIILDQAASFAGDAYVLTGKNDAVELGKRLSVLLRRAGIQSKRTGQPHMTLLYTKRHHAPREIESIMWTATEVALIRSYVGESRHELLGSIPLDAS